MAIFTIIGAHAYKYDEKFNEGFSKGEEDAFKKVEENIKNYSSTKISPVVDELRTIRDAIWQLPILVNILNRCNDDETRHLFLNKNCRDKFVDYLKAIYKVFNDLYDGLYELGTPSICCSNLKESIRLTEKTKEERSEKLSKIIEGKQI